MLHRYQHSVRLQIVFKNKRIENLQRKEDEYFET